MQSKLTKKLIKAIVGLIGVAVVAVVGLVATNQSQDDNELSGDMVNDTNDEILASDLDLFYDSAIIGSEINAQKRISVATKEFSATDKTFYLELHLKEGLPNGTELKIEWFRNDAKLKEESINSDASQQTVLFEQSSPQIIDDYAAVLTIDGITVDEILFSVI